MQDPAEGAAPSAHQHQLHGPIGPSGPHPSDRQREPGDGRAARRHGGGDQGRPAARHQCGVCRGCGAPARARGAYLQGGRALRKSLHRHLEKSNATIPFN